MITADQVEKAAELLKTKWGRHAYHDSRLDTYCAIGALAKVRDAEFEGGEFYDKKGGSFTLDYDTERQADRLFREAGVITGDREVIRWNDSSTCQEVLDGFVTVAKFLRNRGE